MGNISNKNKYIKSKGENFKEITTDFISSNYVWRNITNDEKKIKKKFSLNSIKNDNLVDLSLEIISNCRKRDRLKYKNNITLINSFTLQRVKHENDFLNEINYFEELYKNIKVNVDNKNLSSTKLAKLSLSKISNIKDENNNNNTIIESTSINKIFESNPTEDNKSSLIHNNKIRDDKKRYNTETNKCKTIYSTTISLQNKKVNTKVKKCKKYFVLPSEIEDIKNIQSKPLINHRNKKTSLDKNKRASIKQTIPNPKIKVDVRLLTGDNNTSSDSVIVPNKKETKSIENLKIPLTTIRPSLVRGSSKTIGMENVTRRINKIKKRYSIYPIKGKLKLHNDKKDNSNINYERNTYNDQKALNKILKYLDLPKKEIDMKTITSLNKYNDYYQALRDFRANNKFLFEITKEEKKINDLISKGNCYNMVINSNGNNSFIVDNTLLKSNL